MWNLRKRYTWTYLQNKTYSQTLKTKLWLAKRTVVGRDGLGVWDWHMPRKVYGMSGQWGLAVEHSELYPIFCDNLCGKESEREWTCVREELKNFVVHQKLSQHCKSIIFRSNFKKWKKKKLSHRFGRNPWGGSQLWRPHNLQNFSSYLGFGHFRFAPIVLAQQ